MRKFTVIIEIGSERFEMYAESVVEASELTETILSHAEECDNPDYSVRIISEEGRR